MEDFQAPQWPFDAEKFTNAFLTPTTSFRDSRQYNKERLEAFLSPIITSAQAMKPGLALFDRSSFLPMGKDDDFALDSADNLKVEHQESTNNFYHNQSNQAQLDIMLEPTARDRLHVDFGLDSYQISRSRGPSFNLSKERRGSEDFFGMNLDFLKFFHNPGNDNFMQEADNLQQTIKSEYDPNFQGGHHEPTMYDFQNIPRAKDSDIFVKGENYSEADKMDEHETHTHGTSEENAADESTLQLSGQESDGENSIENPLSADSQYDRDDQPALKKKRRTNNNKVVIEDANKKSKLSKTPKLKKSKSENKNATYSITPKGNSLSLKITKLPEAKDTSSPAKLRIKKQTSKSTKNTDSPTDNTKIEEKQTTSAEKPLELPDVKIENNPALMRSKSSDILSTFFQGKTPSSLSDLVAGLGLPAEVEEMLNSSKIFNNIQSSITKKIGPLTVEERRAKVEKYFEKRKNRTWCKRINYDCRKRVADSRLRFKGRFVTKSQAFGMLAEEGIYPDPNKITENEIRELLEERFGSDPVKKKEKEGDGRKNNGRPKKQKAEDNKDKKKEESNMEDSDEKSSIGSDDEDF